MRGTMAVRNCDKCGGIHFIDDTPYTRAQDYGATGYEVEWLLIFMWMNYDLWHDHG
jgi:hypothetical protein